MAQEDLRKKVQEILTQMPWKEVLALIPDGPQKKWLVNDIGDWPEDEKRLHPEVAAAVRNVAAYQYTLVDSRTRYKNNPEVGSKYLLILTNAFRSLNQAVVDHPVVPPRNAPKTKTWIMPKAKGGEEDQVGGAEAETPAATGRVAIGATRAASRKKEEGMTTEESTPPAKGKGKAPTSVPKVQKKGTVGAGGAFTKAMVGDILKATATNPAAICKVAKESFAVSIKPADLMSAPNGGVMKMRAGNMIKSALKAEGRLGE